MDLEIVPEPGLTLQPDGKRVERDAKEAQKEISDARDAFKKAHPGAKPEEPGPFPWRSIVVVRRYGAHVPQTAVVTFDDGSKETLQWSEEERWHRWVFERPIRVKSVQLDPQRSWLLDLDKLDDGRTREPSPLAGRRWTLELKAWSELAMSILESL